MNLVSSCSIVASLFLALGAKPSWGQDDAEPDFRRPPPGEGLRVQALRLPTLPAESCTLIVVLGDLQHELELRRASVRSANFRLLVDSPDGLVPSEPPPITTYRGTVDGDPDSRVVASLVGGELEASILFGDGNLWQVTPARHLGTSIGRGLHAISALPTRLGPRHAGGTNLVGEPEIAQLGVDSEYRHTRWIGDRKSVV